jgi:DNA invertase Pin-like site-specific DNA recombinase
MPKTIAYIRVSTDKQDSENQKHQILEYAHKNKIMVDEFIELEVSSRKDTKERRIDELLSKLDIGDTLLTVELSRLGRNLMQILNTVMELKDKGVNLIFVRQPELSTTGTSGKLILLIYSYFAETERELISTRTKEALHMKKLSGVKLGRRVGSFNSKLDILRPEIEALLNNGTTQTFIAKRYNISRTNLHKYIKSRGINIPS